MANDIRDATEADLPRIMELIKLGAVRELDEDTRDVTPYREALAEIDAAPHHRVLVVESDGVVVGTGQVFAVRHLQERGGLCAELESVHVHPDVRGGGIGAQLVGELVGIARGWGCYRVQLTSNKARTDAHRFYVRAGFVASHEGFKLLL